MRALEILQKIGDLPLVSGFEQYFIDDFLSLINSFGVNAVKSGLNILSLNNSKSNIVFVSHYDEIGFVVDNRYRNDLYRTIPMGLITWERGYGKVFQTKFKGKIIKAVGSSPLPHSEVEEKRLFLELEEEIELPPLWPFTFENRTIKTKKMFYSKSLDNRVACSSLIESSLSKPINFVLLHGEEQGTTRLKETLEYIEERIENPFFIVIDAAFSSKDEHYKGIEEPKIAYIKEEGGGYGNIAPDNLVRNIKKYVDSELKTNSRAEVTDATTLYRYGKSAISVVYPVRYLHSSLEGVSLDVMLNLKKFIFNFSL